MAYQNPCIFIIPLGLHSVWRRVRQAIEAFSGSGIPLVRQRLKHEDHEAIMHSIAPHASQGVSNAPFEQHPDQDYEQCFLAI